jgi:hypothetical protein
MQQINVNEVYTLFEEIKKQLKQIGEKQVSAPAPVPQPKIEIPDLSVIPELTNKLDEVIGEVRKPVKTEHRHIFSFESNKIFFSVISLSLSLSFLISLFVIYFQQEKLSKYKDNDLKYRYVKMAGKITPEELILLEDIFENKRESIKPLRKDVEKHEKAVLEEAKRLEKARLKEQEAERLRKEAKEIKENK